MPIECRCRGKMNLEEDGKHESEHVESRSRAVVKGVWREQVESDARATRASREHQSRWG